MHEALESNCDIFLYVCETDLSAVTFPIVLLQLALYHRIVEQNIFQSLSKNSKRQGSEVRRKEYSRLSKVLIKDGKPHWFFWMLTWSNSRKLVGVAQIAE